MIPLLSGIFAFWAQLASAAPIVDVPPQVCLVEVKGPKGAGGRCSGVLIGPRMVVTAGHCFALGREEATKETSVTVACKVVSRDSKGNYDFAESYRAVAVQVSSESRRSFGSDFAFVKLSSASRIPPMKVPFSRSAFKQDFLVPSRTSQGNDELHPQLECRFSGFSSATLKAQGGYATNDQSPRNGLKAYFNGMDFIVQGYGEKIGRLNPGDSGGPLYCRKSASKEWTLIAVVSSGAGDLSLWAPIATEGFLGSYKEFSAAWR